MKRSTKAALLSAFVFPGAGHVFLKKYIAGIVLAVTSFSAIYYIFNNALERALQISEKIQSGDIQLDVAAITELVSKQPAGAEAQLLNIATVAVTLCWLIGIVDAYRIGRLSDSGMN
jgi:hypothetical protein